MKRLEWRAGIAFSLLLALLLGNAFLANRSVQGLIEAQRKIDHTWEVRLALRDTQTHFERSLAAIRGYFYLDDPAMLDVWKASRRNLRNALDRLGFLVGDNPRQQKPLHDIEDALSTQSTMVEGNIRLKATIRKRWEPNPTEIKASKIYIATVRDAQKRMDAEELRLALNRSDQARADERRTRLTIFGATATACLALVATFALIRQMLQERLNAERAIRQANAELERRVAERTESLQIANRELEAFSYTVSHDLRAPLRHVAGFADLLEKKSGALLDEPGRRYLTLIQDAGRRAGTLIDDLLAFSRTSRTELNQSLISMERKVAKICAELDVEHPRREIAWEVGPLPEAWGDPALLRLVWRNLLENAVKYSGKQPVSRIRIEARKGATEWEFSVKDNGVGFDMAHADKLFGVFQRLHDTESFEGTGIGLATARRIVARHGGRTWAESAPGEGATFWFSLPRERRDENKEEALEFPA